MTGTVLFLLPYPLGFAPSQRFRVESYFELLQANGIGFQTEEFLDAKTWNILYKKGSFVKKTYAVVKGFLRRLFFIFFKAHRYQYIFIHREATPLGPPFLEWWISRVLKCKIIYDFDDAIWIPNVTEGNKIARFVKCFWKVKWICKWSHKISAGNDFLEAYAKQYNGNVLLNPTCVDTEDKYSIVAPQGSQPPVIGWTGSHSTVRFLAVGIPAIKKLEQKQRFRFLTICDKEPGFGVQCQEFIRWNKETEIEDLARINIGIMPLMDDAWSEGKCGFKLIQYMALGIPAVASPVGVNKKIVDHGINGYLCQTEEEWTERLAELLNDEQKRIEFGKRGREKIVKEYSIAANASNFLSLFSN
jgi:glycosyltransferase involved in cell wall biosynthesis